MVKLQKPIPKKLGNKTKLDNPIKQKKQHLKKDKSATTVVKNTKAKLLDDSTPVKEAKVSLKPAKEVIQKKQNKKELNGEKKSAKKPLILAPPESPKPKEKKSKKKNDEDKSENVVKNGTGKVAKHPKVSEKVAKKVISLPEPLVAVKLTKPSKKVKDAAVKDEPASSKLAAPVVKAVPAKAEDLAPPKDSKKKKKQSIATEIEPVAPVLAKKSKPIPQKETESIAPKPKEKEEPAAPVPAKPGKKQKQKNKKAAVAVAAPTPAIEKIKNVKKPKNRMQEKKVAKVAFRKAQLAAKDQPKKEKKPKVGPSFRYDPIPYDEEKFNSIVNKENIKKIAEALKNTVQKEVSTKKSTIFDDYRYFLQIGSFKIPNCPKRMVKLNLKHSLVGKDDDVLLVVPDLQRGAKVDYEPTKHHYEDMLRHYGIEGITIMPMNQLRKEHGTYEQKRRLCASYEYYMCDARIVSHVGAIVGKLTQKPRNTFHAVRLNENKDIKNEIEKSLKRTAYRQVAKSNLHTIPVGTHKYTTEQLVENIEFVVDQLKKIFPGGMGNVRNLHLRIGLTGTSSLPLYISMGQAPEKTPMVIGPREERMIKLKKEANEVLTKFAMTKEGKLIKLSKTGVEKKRKVQELKTALKEEEETARKAKKAKKASEKEAKNGKEVKELELPENEEEEDDDNSSDEDDEDAAQVGSGSDDETEDDEMANLDEDAESGAEIVENGFVGEDDEESEDDDEADASENDDDDEEDDDDDDDEDEAEESD